MAKNFGSGVLGGVVLVDPATGLPYKATGGGGGGGAVDSVNGEVGTVVLTAPDVGARDDTWEPSVDEINATGTPDSTTYLRGDGTWATPAGGGGAVDSVNGQTGVVVLDAGDVGARPDDWEPSTDDVLPAQADQGGKVIMTDGSTASWQPLPPVPPTVATIVYTADDEARPVGADIVFWVPENPSLGDPENAAVDDLVIRSVADAVQGLNGTVGLWRGTQLEYDAIVSPNPNVVYVVLED